MIANWSIYTDFIRGVQIASENLPHSNLNRFLLDRILICNFITDLSHGLLERLIVQAIEFSLRVNGLRIDPSYVNFNQDIRVASRDLAVLLRVSEGETASIRSSNACAGAHLFPRGAQDQNERRCLLGEGKQDGEPFIENFEGPEASTSCHFPNTFHYRAGPVCLPWDRRSLFPRAWKSGDKRTAEYNIATAPWSLCETESVESRTIL